MKNEIAKTKSCLRLKIYGRKNKMNSRNLKLLLEPHSLETCYHLLRGLLSE